MLPLLFALHLGVPALHPPDLLQAMTPVRPAPGAPRLEPPMAEWYPAPEPPPRIAVLHLHAPSAVELPVGAAGVILGHAGALLGGAAIALPAFYLNELSVRGVPDCVNCLEPAFLLSALVFLALDAVLPPAFAAGLESRVSDSPRLDTNLGVGAGLAVHAAAIVGTVMLLNHATFSRNYRPAMAYFAGTELALVPLASSLGLHATWDTP